MSDFKWKNIVRCAVRNLPRHNSPLTAGRSYWFAVAELCGVGSTSAIELCEMFGIDPDQKMPMQLTSEDINSVLTGECRSYQDIKNLAPETIRTWQDLMSGHHIEEPRRAEQENKDDC